MSPVTSSCGYLAIHRQRFAAAILPTMLFQHVLKYVFLLTMFFSNMFLFFTASSSSGHFSHNNKFQHVIPNNTTCSNMFWNLFYMF